MSVLDCGGEAERSCRFRRPERGPNRWTLSRCPAVESGGKPRALQDARAPKARWFQRRPSPDVRPPEPDPPDPMNAPDDFERQLARTPLRGAPKNWRAEILANATAAARGMESPRSRGAGISGPRGLGLRLWAWFDAISPAWRTLAAVWIVCLAVNRLTSSPPTGSLASRGDRGSLAPEQIAAARAQRAELLQLAGLSEPRPPEPQPARPPGPRSCLGRPERPHYG